MCNCEYCKKKEDKKCIGKQYCEEDRIVQFYVCEIQYLYNLMIQITNKMQTLDSDSTEYKSLNIALSETIKAYNNALTNFNNFISQLGANYIEQKCKYC